MIFSFLLCIFILLFLRSNVYAAEPEPTPNVIVESISKEELQEVTSEIYAQYMQDRQQELLEKHTKQVKAGTTFAAVAILLMVVLRFYQSR